MVSSKGTSYADNTDIKVVAIIENVLGTSRRLRVFYGDNVTGED